MTNPAQYITGRTVQEQMNQLISYVDTRAAEVATTAIASDMATLAQAVSDAQDARDASIAAKDTAVSTVSDCVKKTPNAAQTISNYPLTVSQGVVADVTGDLTGNVTGNVTGDVTGDLAGDVNSSGSSSFSGSVTVPTEATGTFTTKAANSTKVKAELDNYTPMVRNTGAQSVAGFKKMNVTVPVFEYTSANLVAGWYKVAKLVNGRFYKISNIAALTYNNSSLLYQEIAVVLPNPSVAPTAVFINKVAEILNNVSAGNYIAVAYNANDNAYYLYVNHPVGLHHSVSCDVYIGAGAFDNSNGAIEPLNVQENPTVNSQVVYYP